MGRSRVSSVAVDRISLQVPSLSAEEGRLARLLADGLAAAVPPGGGASIGSVAVSSGGAGASVDELARWILAEIAAQLRRQI